MAGEGELGVWRGGGFRAGFRRGRCMGVLCASSEPVACEAQHTRTHRPDTHKPCAYTLHASSCVPYLCRLGASTTRARRSSTFGQVRNTQARASPFLKGCLYEKVSRQVESMCEGHAPEVWKFSGFGLDEACAPLAPALGSVALSWIRVKLLQGTYKRPCDISCVAWYRSRWNWIL